MEKAMNQAPAETKQFVAGALRTPAELDQFVDGLKQGAEDAVRQHRADLDALHGPPHFADGYSQGFTSIRELLHEDE